MVPKVFDCIDVVTYFSKQIRAVGSSLSINTHIDESMDEIGFRLSDVVGGDHIRNVSQ